MVFVQQFAGRYVVLVQVFDSSLSLLVRILRAMFEICLKRGWAVPARAALDLCKMAEKRMWGSMTPLRQFKRVPADVLRKAEGKQFVCFYPHSLVSQSVLTTSNFCSLGTVISTWCVNIDQPILTMLMP